MQFTGRSKEQVLLGVQRLRTMAPSNPPTSLGLAFELSMSLSNDTKTTISTVDMPSCPSPPIQLELLPLRPSSMMRSQAHDANSLLFANGQYMASQHISNRGIDMNQIPLSPESEEEMCDYPALQLSDSMRGGAMEGGCGSPGLKREREKATEADQERVYEVSSRASDEEEGGSTRKKLRLSKEQSALLEESFKEHSTLNPKQKNALAKQLNLRPRQVEVWFQNRRARTKLKQTEVDCELLKRCCESLTEENRRLQKELQELRALKVTAPCVIAHDFYMPLPAATLTMCPSCERLATMDNRSLSSLTFSKPQLPLNFPQQQQPSAAC